MNLWTGILMLVIAVGLVFVGRPNKEGAHPRFLRFDAAMVLYTPVILVFFALGTAAIITGLVR